MNTLADREALAAEYVLGSLDADERAQARDLIASDPDFAAEVLGWERWLGGLSVMVDEVEPASDVWERTRKAIATVPQAGGMRLPRVASGKSEAAQLAQRLTLWRLGAGLAAAIAAGLAVMLMLALYQPDLLPAGLHARSTQGRAVPATQQVPAPEAAPAPAAQAENNPAAPAPSLLPARYVAALQKDAGMPAFLLVVDPDARMLIARRVAADYQPGKSFELWLVSEKFPTPRSLGVMSAGDVTVRPLAAEYDRATIANATYAMSLEPDGGSPSGVPTGPVLYLGKLVDVTAPPAVPSDAGAAAPAGGNPEAH